MRIALEDYVGRDDITVTVVTKITTRTGGKYSGNIHYGDMLIGGVSGTTDKALLAILPERQAKTPASLIRDKKKIYVQFDSGTKIEAIPLLMS